MEAVHEIPVFLAHWSKHDLGELRLHLASYPSNRWLGTPDLMRVFDDKLAELSARVRGITYEMVPKKRARGR